MKKWEKAKKKIVRSWKEVNKKKAINNIIYVRLNRINWKVNNRRTIIFMYKNSFKNKNYYLFIYFFHIKIYQNLETTSANNSSSSSSNSSSINNNNTSDFSPDYRRQMIQLKVLYYMHHWRQAIKTNEWVLKSFNYYHQWCFLFCYSLNFFPFFCIEFF